MNRPPRRLSRRQAIAELTLGGAGLLLAGCAYAGLVTWSARREARIARADALLVGIGIYLTHLIYGAGSIVGWFRGRRTGER